MQYRFACAVSLTLMPQANLTGLVLLITAEQALFFAVFYALDEQRDKKEIDIKLSR